MRLPPAPHQRRRSRLRRGLILLNAAIAPLFVVAVTLFLAILWRLLGNYRAVPSDRDTALVCAALFGAGLLAGWVLRGLRKG